MKCMSMFDICCVYMLLLFALCMTYPQNASSHSLQYNIAVCAASESQGRDLGADVDEEGGGTLSEPLA